eukprot:329898_1
MSRFNLERRRHRKRSRDSFGGMQNLTVQHCLERFSHLLDSGIHSDIAVVVGGEEARIPVHRCVLALGSPAFKAMLDPKNDYKEAKEGEIRIIDFDEKVIRVLLHFLYTGRLDISSSSPDEEEIGSPQRSTSSKRKKQSKKVRFDVNQGTDSDEEYEAHTPPPSPSLHGEVCHSNGSRVPSQLNEESEKRTSDLLFLVDVILSAEKYQVPKLGRLCQLLICDHLSIKDVVPVVTKLQPFLNIEVTRVIRKRCIQLVVGDFQNFRQIDGFNDVMNNCELRDLIFDEMALQSKIADQERRLSEEFDIMCHPVYEQDWISFKVRVSGNDSILVMKARIQEHMNSDYSFDRETVAVNIFYDELQTRSIEADTNVLTMKNESHATIYVERFPST